MKKLRRVVIAILALIVIGLVIVYFALNSIVRSAVESQSSASLNVPTKLGGATLAVFGGTLDLNKFSVGSPAKFTAPQMLSLDNVRTEVDYGQLTSTPVRIKKIVMDRPKLVIEQANLKFNFQALMDQMPRQPDNQKPPMKVMIDELQVNNASVVFMSGLPGLAKEITVPIPSVKLTNIGNADGNRNGAAIKDVIMATITALASKAGESGLLPGDLKQMLNGQLSEVAQKLGGEMQKQIQGLTDKITKDLPVKDLPVKDVGKDVEKGLGGLLGGKKEPKK